MTIAIEMTDAHRRRNLLAACAAVIVFGFALGLTYPLLSLMMAEAGFSDFMIGLNGATTCIGVILAVFCLPRLLHAYGAFAVVVAGLAGAAAFLDARNPPNGTRAIRLR